MIPVPDFTVGNTITVAVAIYKHNWKKYLKLSLVAHLWLLVPVYGWARYFAIAAWISKLSFNELVAQPDNIDQKEYFTLRSLFIFLFTALVTIFIIAVTMILSSLFIFVFIFIAVLLQIILEAPILDRISEIIDQAEGVGYWVFFWSIILLFSLTSTFSYVRLFLTDLGFVGNHTSKLFNLISKSYSLTKQKFKIFGIILQSFVFICPIWIISFFLIIIVSGFLLWGIKRFVMIQISISAFHLGLYIIIGWFILTNLLTMPFWQSVKAFTYHKVSNERDDYDLRSNH